jgi:hypothetical protein
MELKDVLTLALGGIGAAVALITLVRALVEYRRQGVQRRAEQFFALRRRLKENGEFTHIAGLLDAAAAGHPSETVRARQELRGVRFSTKRDYLGLFEEVALAMNSQLINPSVAHYMFGYYAILCWESDDFWEGVNKLTPYWSLLADFVERMKLEQQSFEFERSTFRF